MHFLSGMNQMNQERHFFSCLIDIQTPSSHILNTRKSVLSDINYTRIGGVFHLPSKYREVIYQTQEEVFHLISKHWLNISTTTRSVSSYIQTLLSPTLEVFHPGVSSDIQTQRSNILNTRRSVSSNIQTPRRNYAIKHEKVCVAAKIYTPRDNRLNTRKSVSSDIQTPRSNLLFLLISKHRNVIG